MKKRLLLCLTLTYCVGIIFGGTSNGKQFWEKRIPKHTYKNEIEGMAELENENAKAGESDEEKRVADIDPIVQTQKAKTQNVDEMNYDYLLKNYFLMFGLVKSLNRMLKDQRNIKNFFLQKKKKNSLNL